MSGDTDSGLLSVVGIRPRLAHAETLPDQIEGAGVSIACQLVEGYPAADVFWFKDGRDIDLESDMVTIGQNHDLRIASVQPHHAGDYTCRAQNSEGVDSLTVTLRVLRRTVIVNSPAYYQYKEGEQVIFNCQVEVDDKQGSLQINWYKGDEKLILDHPQGDESTPRMMLLPNSSLAISGVQQSDLGYYSCEAVTGISPPVRSAHSQIYLPQLFPVWIIIIIAILLIIGLLIFFCLCIGKCREAVKGEGYYCVDDMEASDKKHDKSDIFYTTEDCDSVMQETDNIPRDIYNPTSTPLFTPKTIRLLSKIDQSSGSVGSLLSDDEFLNKGMEEDGSFRERYLQ